MTALMGPADSILRRVEQATRAAVTVRGNQISITGATQDVGQVATLFNRLIEHVEAGDNPSPDDVVLLLDQVERGYRAPASLADDVLLTYRGRAIRPKTQGQQRYVESIRHNTITFGLGPAGTGKTYLAMAMAVAAYKRREVGRIVLARPVVEAGESLGFLPGTLEEKLDPYVRPLYDALFEMLGAETYQKYLERGNIEVAPLAYMRGRTLDDSFIILDEAQNTSREQMKMFLTRIGFGSHVVITGDVTQIDLPPDKTSGLKEAMRILDAIDDIAICRLTPQDVVRHALVQKIIEAYDRAAHTEEPAEKKPAPKKPAAKKPMGRKKA